MLDLEIVWSAGPDIEEILESQPAFLASELSWFAEVGRQFLDSDPDLVSKLFQNEVMTMRTLVATYVSSAYKLFDKFTNYFHSPFLLAVRLYWGWQFAQSGWGKLNSIPRVTDFFASLNIPFPHANAVLVSNLEFFGGILLILGFASKLTGLVLTGNMLVAYITADREALGSILSDPGKFYAADPYTFLFASLIVLLFGAGLFSVDAIIKTVGAERAPRVRPMWPSSASGELLQGDRA